MMMCGLDPGLLEPGPKTVVTVGSWGWELDKRFAVRTPSLCLEPGPWTLDPGLAGTCLAPQGQDPTAKQH
eukprot:scaffold522289_cov17-Prasinocladus_malaysianus.AAC.1